MSKGNRQQPEPGTDLPICLLADGRMMDLSGRACNVVVQFVYPDAVGCSTITVMHLRPGSDLAEVSINDDLGEASRVKFAKFLEAMAKSLRHYRPGEVQMEDMPAEEETE